MANFVSISPELIESYSLDVRPANGGWEIVCSPGPLAQFMLSAAAQVSIEQQGKDLCVIVPFTEDLDREIVRMIQALIDLRYRTGQVQLELWANL